MSLIVCFDLERINLVQIVALLIYIQWQGAPAEGGTVDQPHSNRFNAVIEKIERLYMVSIYTVLSVA